MGLDENTFWRKTPRQIVRTLQAKGEQFKREHNERAWLAWHIAALPRAKKFPKLEDLMKRGPRKAMTPDQIFDAMRAIAASQGKG